MGIEVRRWFWTIIPIAGAFLLTIALSCITSCTRSRPAQNSDSPTSIKPPKPAPPAPVQQSGRLVPPSPEPLQGSGLAVWAKGYQGPLIAGLDGMVYDSYRPATVRRVQNELRGRGLYTGPTNGILDLPTMKSIYEFQIVNNLQRCGVPTPHTRRILEQGSHTDLGL